ncbi:MAG TPA: PAS domain S-box protein [Candidatus Udaeobacter sp.]|nr:PAS domain S-box protein [Candidatus Udaeobacter sp.]
MMKRTSSALQKFSSDGAVRRISKNGAPIHSIRTPAVRNPKTELEAATQRFVDLYDFAPIAYVSFERAGRIEEANLAATELLGVPRDLLIGRPFAFYVTDLDLFLHHLLCCRTSHEQVKTELQLKPRKGEPIPAQLLSTPITSTTRNGALLYQTAIIDLSERKRHEQQLTEQARLLDLSNDAIIVRDKNERITYWNRGATKLYGYTRQEAVGAVIQHLLKSKFPEPLPKIYEKLIRDNHWQGEIVHTRRDGKRLTVFSRWALDRDAQGNRGYVLETNNDISERKRAEQRQTVNLAVTKILAESPALIDAVQRILQSVCETLGWEAGAFWTQEPKAGVLRCLTGWECHPRRFLNFKRTCSELTLAPGVGLPGVVWSSRKPTWISDMDDTDFPRARIAATDGLHAAFAFPISFRKRFLAVMECFSCEIREPDEELLKIFASIGSQIGQFIQRKEAEAALQKSKELLEQRVRQRTSELHAANKMMKDEIARRKGLEGEILEISDREQQRLGQELHDGLCQHLTAVAFMARSVGLRLKNHRVIEVADIEKIAQLVNDAATDTRNLSRALHRIDVDAAGLVDALRDLVDREIWRIPCQLEFKPSFHIDNDIAAGELYRIAREAVINANKHSQARKIVIRLEGVENEMVLRVIDDGTGFPSEPKTKRGLGAHIMGYRARLIGARLEIDTPKRGGTCVSCYLPNNALQSQERKNARMRSFTVKITKALAALI